MRVLGRDPYAMPAREAARLVAVVPQDLVPAFSFTVLEMVLMGRTPYLSSLGRGGEEDWARARAAMVATGVQHLADRPVEELSGGERRRVEIARSLATNPAFILLDEPFAGIDPIAVIDIQSIIAGLKNRGIGILISDHNVRETLGVCDQAYILNEGKILERGTPEEIAQSRKAREIYLGEKFRF